MYDTARILVNIHDSLALFSVTSTRRCGCGVGGRRLCVDVITFSSHAAQ
jgi:hypothetical protein